MPQTRLPSTRFPPSGNQPVLAAARQRPIAHMGRTLRKRGRLGHLSHSEIVPDDY